MSLVLKLVNKILTEEVEERSPARFFLKRDKSFYYTWKEGRVISRDDSVIRHNASSESSIKDLSIKLKSAMAQENKAIFGTLGIPSGLSIRIKFDHIIGNDVIFKVQVSGPSGWLEEWFQDSEIVANGRFHEIKYVAADTNEDILGRE